MTDALINNLWQSTLFLLTTAMLTFRHSRNVRERQISRRCASVARSLDELRLDQRE
jgi:hypothetical protein